MRINFIAGDNEGLFRQAPMTAKEYMNEAVEAIDEKFGKGYAKRNPELIGAFMQTAAFDLGAAIIARAIEAMEQSETAELNAAARHIEDGLNEVASSIDSFGSKK